MDQTSLQGIPYNGPSNTGRYPELGTRYAPLGHPGGWCAVAAKVREFDEEKVKDTKEDIDTLLVFVSSLPGCFFCTKGLRYLGIGWFILGGALCLPGRVLSKTLARYGITNPGLFDKITSCHATYISADG